MKWITPLVACVSSAVTTVGVAVAFGPDGRGTTIVVAGISGLMAVCVTAAVAGADRRAERGAGVG